MADQILYDHGGIDSGAEELRKVAGKSRELLDTGNASRTSLESSWDGTASGSFQDVFGKLQKANQSIIDVTTDAVESLRTANNDMRDTDTKMAGMFGA
jgi:WXG100 family type VII secretion target